MADPLAPSRDRPSKQGNEQQPGALDRPSLGSLLLALDPDAERAGQKYTDLFERLRRFFEWNGCEQSELLADQTLDRLARRIHQKDPLEEPVREPAKFAAGIARLILHESRRGEQRIKRAAEVFHQDRTLAATTEKEQSSALLEDCLDRLTFEQRQLIERYYSRDARNHIGARAALAAELGISLNALRNRALRIRADLERCFQRCKPED